MEKEKSDLIEFLVREFTERREAAGTPEEKKVLDRQVIQYRFLPRRTLDPKAGDVIVPPALIRLQHERGEIRVFLVPGGGGQVLQHAGHAVKVLTPQSPLGAALLGKTPNVEFEVEVGDGARKFKVLDYC